MSRSDIYAALKYRSHQRKLTWEVNSFLEIIPSQLCPASMYFQFLTSGVSCATLTLNSNIDQLLKEPKKIKNELFRQQVEASLTISSQLAKKPTQSIITVLSDVVDQFNTSVKFTSDMKELGINITIPSKDDELENNENQFRI